MPTKANAFLLALVISLAIVVIAMALHPPPPITEDQYAAAQKAAKDAACQYSPLRCFWNWTTHDPVAFYTFVLAIFTCVLGVSTIGLWIQTGKAANAAQAAAEHIPRVERARLYVVMESENVSTSLSLAASEFEKKRDRKDWTLVSFGIGYSFRNYGKTPAFIHEIGHQVIVADEEPRIISYRLQVPLPVDFVLGPDRTTTRIGDVAVPKIRASDALAIRDMKATFWFCGYVVFDDAFGNRFEQQFKWHYSAVSDRFCTYSYREIERKT